MGLCRPPLYTMGDGFRGFPAFLTNSFAGNSREELLIGMRYFNLMTDKEIVDALCAVDKFQLENNKHVVQGVTDLNT